MKTRVIGNKTSEKIFSLKNRKYFSTKSRNIYGDFLQTILLIHNHNVILFFVLFCLLTVTTIFFDTANTGCF